MFEYLRAWYQRHFSDPQVITLTLFLVGGFAFVIFAGEILAPVLASIVIAYLLDGAVQVLQRSRLPRIFLLLLVFALFLALTFIVFFVLVPALSKQLTQFVVEVPNMVSHGQALLMQLPERFPNLVTTEQVNELIASLRSELVSAGQAFIGNPFANVVGILTLFVYLILVPLLVFFFVKDKEVIIRWIEGFMPQERALTSEVWFEVNQKIASYVRGKAIEIFLVWSVCYVTFSFFDLRYSMLLSFLVGLSVIIPYAGAAVVTVPVAVVAYSQWGFATETLYVLVAYLIIQFLDGNLLVPLLFSEVVNLHPVAIIIAVLFFGGLWGVWGVFFAIPLATLINAVINAWPSRNVSPESTEV